MTLRTSFTYVASLVLALLAAEGILRLGGARFSSSFYVLDADLGWALRPNARGDNTQEATVAIEINSAGQRDNREHSLAKPPGVYRVAILGDSFAEAFQVPVEESFPKLLEQELNGCLPDRKTEVLNFAVGGYGTAQELLSYRLRARQYAPDFVVLLFYTGNDIYNNHPLLNPTNADAAPYFTLDNGALQMKPALAQPSALREVWAATARNSQVSRMISDIYYKARRNNTAHEQQRLQTYGENYMNRLVFSPPRDAAMQEAWTLTEAALPAVYEEIKRDTPRFLLAIASSNFQVHPEREKREGFLQFSGATELFYAENRLAAIAANHQIPTAFLGPAMLAAADGKGVFYHGFPGSIGSGHWNSTGHAFVAKALKREICPATQSPRDRSAPSSQPSPPSPQ